jgi:hypothetical protein
MCVYRQSPFPRIEEAAEHVASETYITEFPHDPKSDNFPRR